MGRNKKYFDEYEEYRLYQETFGTESSNDKDFGEKESHKSRETKNTKGPLTKEELDRNGKVIRIVFITLGLIFSVLTLWNNIGWLFFLPQFASWSGIIISIIVLVLIVKNINYHCKERKKAKVSRISELRRYGKKKQQQSNQPPRAVRYNESL